MKSLKIKVILFLFLLLLPGFITSQSKKTATGNVKLMVGIVVDQMRNDYLYRYWDRYSSGGFKRLVSQGFYFRNMHYNFVPTYTGPGHASIYTGTTPQHHGIIANEWPVKNTAGKIGCVQDSTVKPTGARGKTGMASPKNLLSSTIGDEMKMCNQKSKVYGISLKDRSAILPAGHAADAAFWFDENTGEFTSSSWYLSDLPRWLKNFNDEHYPKLYLEKWWSTLYPIETYTSSGPDENRYESTPSKKDYPVFPYDYKSFIEKGDYSILRFTPFGNTLVKELAIECVLKEEMGKDVVPDLLCVSFSSTDYIGHAFGPRSVETEDTYLRLDKDIEDLLNRLDKEIGKGNYLVFLTADHGAADIPGQLLDNKIPAGYIKETKLLREVRRFFSSVYGDSTLVTSIMNEQIYLNEKKIESARFDKNALEEKLCNFLLLQPGISQAYPSTVLKYGSFPDQDIRRILQNGYNFQLSGNVCFTYKPGWMENAEKGTTHGGAYNYDTHVPFLLFGNGIPPGQSFELVHITQIAPSICEILKINQPNTSGGQLLNSLIR